MFTSSEVCSEVHGGMSRYKDDEVDVRVLIRKAACGASKESDAVDPSVRMEAFDEASRDCLVFTGEIRPTK